MVISLLVLVGTTLLGRTLLNLETTDVGFNTSNVLLFQVNMRASGITKFDDPRFGRYNRTLQERFAALRGVSSASYSIMPLLGGGSFGGDFRVPGAPASAAFTEEIFLVGPRFFETMGIPTSRPNAHGSGLWGVDRAEANRRQQFVREKTVWKCKPPRAHN